MKISLFHNGPILKLHPHRLRVILYVVSFITYEVVIMVVVVIVVVLEAVS